MFCGSQFSYSIFCTWFHAVNFWITSELFWGIFLSWNSYAFWWTDLAATLFLNHDSTRPRLYFTLLSSLGIFLNRVIFWSYVSPFSVSGLFMLRIFGYTSFNVFFWYLRRLQTTFTFSRSFLKSFRFPSFLPPQPLEPFTCHLLSSLILLWFLILEPSFPFLYDWRLQDLEGIPTYLLTWFLILTSEANHIIASFVERFWILLLFSHKLDLQSRTITYSAPSNSSVFPSFSFLLPFVWLWLPAIFSAPFCTVDHSNWESPVNDDCIFVGSADHAGSSYFPFLILWPNFGLSSISLLTFLCEELVFLLCWVDNSETRFCSQKQYLPKLYWRLVSVEGAAKFTSILRARVP